MEYQILPMGDVWTDGSFFVPAKITSNYIKLASEYQLKALLLVLSSNGRGNSKDIAKALGCTENDADDFLDFWVEEGFLARDGKSIPAPVCESAAPSPEKKEEKTAKRLSSVPVPTLSPKEIVSACNEDPVLTSLMHESQEVLGKTLSHSEQELIINMVNFYGLPSEIVLTILHYYKTQREKGKVCGTYYVATMAKNWSEEGITTLDAADEKLKDLEKTDKLWLQVLEVSGLRHKDPTPKQRDMIKQWFSDFSIDMIALACDIMKEKTDRPALAYVNTILKNWKKKNIKTPDDVNADNEKHRESKDTKTQDIDTTYDINEIAKKAMFNDNYDI